VSSTDLVYLACPYSHPDPLVRRRRFLQASRAAGLLIREGHKVFSPVSHTHPVADAADLPLGFDFWRDYDLTFLRLCKTFVLLQVDGWDRSLGVAAELEEAKRLKLRVFYFTEKQLKGGTVPCLKK
jgi:hypothetical protein